MIVGIGTDICKLDRIKKLLESDKKEAFIKRTFTVEEIENLPSEKRSLSYYAGRWAAKEAISKCFGTGFGEHCRWLDITIKRNESGAPSVFLTDTTAETAKRMGIDIIHISISHEKDYAVAFATAEKR